MRNKTMKTKQKCVICKQMFEGFGNNPQPLKEKGACCDQCNLQLVVPKRINLMNQITQILKQK